jgi:hypothetical protein
MGDRVMSLRIEPGNIIFVPEKIEGGSAVWQNIIGVAQLTSANTLPPAIGGIF